MPWPHQVGYSPLVSDPERPFAVVELAGLVSLPLELLVGELVFEHFAGYLDWCC